MKTINFEFDNIQYPLCLNGAALFDIYDKFGRDKDVTSLVTGADGKSFFRLCWIIAKLSEQGSAVKRYLGGDPPKPLEVVRLFLLLRPVEVLHAKEAVKLAVAIGFARSVSEDDEESLDPWLEEINQKKTKRRRCRDRSLFSRR